MQDQQEDCWLLKEGARLPSEAELRRSVTPDQWCALDSMKVGQHRIFEMGSVRPDELISIPVDRMQIAIEQLPEVRLLGYTTGAFTTRPSQSI